MTTKLHIGCGKDIKEGWVNLDCIALPGVDVVADLNTCHLEKLPFEEDSIDELLASHVLEHIPNVLTLMEELHRIAKQDAILLCRVPYGSSDDAYEDPTHVRQFFLHSFAYFSQSAYWRADYGYRGDWAIEKIQLIVPFERYQNQTAEMIFQDIQKYRNVVQEMIVTLRAVKPIRQAMNPSAPTYPIEI